MAKRCPSCPVLVAVGWSTFTLLHVPWCQARTVWLNSWRALTDELCQQGDCSSSSSGCNGNTSSALPRWSYCTVFPLFQLQQASTSTWWLPPIHHHGETFLLTGVYGAHLTISENICKMATGASASQSSQCPVCPDKFQAWHFDQAAWPWHIKSMKKPTKETTEDSQHFMLFPVGMWLFITQSTQARFEQRLHAAGRKTV